VAAINNKEFSIGNIAVIISISMIVLIVLGVLMANFLRDDTPNEITWVG